VTSRTGVRPNRFVNVVAPFVGLLGVLGAWTVGRSAGVLPKSTVPSVLDTWRALRKLLGLGEFWARLAQTGQSWAVGLAVATVIALPLGVAVGASDWMRRFTRVTIEALRPIPPIVVLPIALLTLKGGLAFKVALITQGALWPLFIQTAYGVRATDPVALDTAKSFRLGMLRRLFLVRLPAAAGPIATGLRLAAATAFAVSMVTEIVGGAKGIGAYLVSAQVGGDSATVFALTIVAGLFGLLIAFVFGRIEKRVFRFSPRSV
jgi:ABC-type nitrate/sulfonate/bicarbonate transport system permease component